MAHKRSPWLRCLVLTVSSTCVLVLGACGPGHGGSDTARRPADAGQPPTAPFLVAAPPTLTPNFPLPLTVSATTDAVPSAGQSAARAGAVEPSPPAYDPATEAALSAAPQQIAGAARTATGWGQADTPAVAVPAAPGNGWKAVPTFWGVATYYGADFNGQPMAAGPIYNMMDPRITASNYWPLGTRLRIHRIPGSPWDSLLSDAERQAYFNRTITVTVLDRGAFYHALDLSYGAFSELGRPAEGVIRVQIEPLDNASAPHYVFGTGP